ncbi:hypothetical protein EDB89DRAFT_1913291 [Lactarius sanguifluus]|nr:hypothetical protein EDB89DRAFT_1913291 [Lactarius sanguifluus]
MDRQRASDDEEMTPSYHMAMDDKGTHDYNDAGDYDFPDDKQTSKQEDSWRAVDPMRSAECHCQTLRLLTEEERHEVISQYLMEGQWTGEDEGDASVGPTSTKNDVSRNSEGSSNGRDAPTDETLKPGNTLDDEELWDAFTRDDWEEALSRTLGEDDPSRRNDTWYGSPCEMLKDLDDMEDTLSDSDSGLMYWTYNLKAVDEDDKPSYSNEYDNNRDGYSIPSSGGDDDETWDFGEGNTLFDLADKFTDKTYKPRDEDKKYEERNNPPNSKAADVGKKAQRRAQPLTDTRQGNTIPQHLMKGQWANKEHQQTLGHPRNSCSDGRDCRCHRASQLFGSRLVETW